MSASISVTWLVPSCVYVPVAWLNVICAMSMSMLALLVSELFVVARQSFFSSTHI